jgi:amino acid adenylation domain-containing protein
MVAAPLTKRLRGLARQRSMTLFMVLEASLSMLIFRWTGVTDVVLGIPVGGRELSGADNMIGCFSKVLPLRVPVDGWRPAETVLASARDSCLAMLNHQDVPFEEIAQAAGSRSDASRHALYSIMFTVGTPIDELELPGLDVTVDVADRRITDTTLTVSVMDLGDRLELTLEYDDGMYDEATMRRFAGHWRNLMASLADGPERRVCDLALMSASERSELLAAGDHTSEALTDEDLTLDGAFATQVAATPNATAVIDDHGRYSYRSLAGRVAALAARLGTEVRAANPVVAVALPPCVDYVAAVLAVLHRGGTYLALDPGLPDDRLRWMMRDSGTQAVIVDNEGLRRFSGSLAGVRLIGCDLGEAADALVPVRRASHGERAYLVYTSGSQGRPKAVVGTHAGTMNRLFWEWSTFPATVGDRCCLKTSPSFVDAVAELFSGLLRGVPTVIVSAHDRADPALLAARLASASVTHLVLVPDLLSALLELPDSGRLLGGLRRVTSSGSRLTRELVRNFMARLPHVTLLNVYGSSEVAADVTWWSCTGDEDRVPIGSPISGVSAWIVDETGNLAPIGVPGELLIGGIALAHGYAHRPGLTARAFIPDPWNPGNRLYRTGDRARWRQPGTLEYLGRLDTQIKIRGVRIEPGEIEAVLSSCPGVTESAVVTRTNSTGDIGLAAFTVGAAASREVRAFLRAKLPDAMIPTVTAVDHLPRTPGGKVDRVTLASWSIETSSGRELRPSTPAQLAVASAWGEVLGTPDPSLEDDFFQLGGHSLLIARLAARLSALLGRNVPIRLIHDNPALGDLCEALRSSRDPVDAHSTQSRPRIPASAVTQITRSRIDFRILGGSTPPLTAAAVSYVPGWWLRDGVVTAGQWESEFSADGAFLAGVLETPLGRIGTLVAPIAAEALYDEPARTAEIAALAVERARSLGAQAVSLTGLLPSATGYGREVAARTGIPVTTGHDVTAAAVNLTILAALARSHRPIGQETLCVLGAGSIGMSSLWLLIDTGKFPARIVLCDLFARRDFLEREAEALRVTCPSEVEVTATQGAPPAEVYQAGVIIGAVNVGGVLDVAKVRPGCIVVDDSFPRCFDVNAAVQRMYARQDAVFLEAGLLAAPMPLPEERYIPDWLLPALGDGTTRRFEREAMGCVLSSGLMTTAPDLSPTLGSVRRQDSVASLAHLVQSGFTAALPQCGHYVVPALPRIT